MTRESVPRFDLYGELEVSRSATGEVIEAAYRALVKNHHPDVARPADRARMTRLNLAREWLIDPSRRARYDAVMGVGPGRPGVAQRPVAERPMHGRTPEQRWDAAQAPTAPGGFGVNSDEIRAFLAELRALDAGRAVQVLSGKSAAEPEGYADARAAALAASRKGRHDEWAFAREAASVITKGKLGETKLSLEIATVVADVAGAMVVRDLITRDEYELLLLPWAWRAVARSGALADSASGGPASASGAARAMPKAGLRKRGLPRPTLPDVSMPRLPRPRMPGRGRRAEAGAELFAPATAAFGSSAGLSRVPPARPSALALVTASPVLIAIVIVAIIGGAFVVLGRPSPSGVIAVGGETSFPTPDVATPAPTQLIEPTPPPTAAPPSPTAPTPTLDPAQVPALQASAATAIANLASVAASGDVAAAQALLGDSAPDLRASGLLRAIFTDVPAAEIGVTRDAAGFVATAGADRLTSTDGTSWTFDYGNRPLAAYGRSAERDVYWIEPDGRHDIFLRVSSVEITKAGVTVHFAWKYRPDSPNDAYFRRAALAITSITLGAQTLPLATRPTMTIDPPVRTGALEIPGAYNLPGQVLVQVTITPRVGAGGGEVVRPISTVFELREG